MSTPLRLLAIACLLGLGPGLAESAPPAGAPRLVRVSLGGALTPQRLVESGFDVLEVHAGSHCVLFEWPGDRERLAALGASGEVLDPDPGRTAAARARADLAARPREAWRRPGVTRAQVAPPFGSGSLAGYWTLAEIETRLNELIAADANDVVADQLDVLGTSLQGRPIWGLRLGKAVTGPDPRPVAFLNSLTHAREPGGMQTLLHFVEHLLARYGVDPFATYLLDHRVIYVVPVVNPDGYKLNEDYWVANGAFGFHRKNLRDTNGNGQVNYSSDGVDINRNFGFQWVGPGSSTSPSSQTYRGPAPFSEPESQAQRDIVIALRPKTGISFHTYGDFLLHSWGHTPVAPPDSMKFYAWDDDMTLGNGYQSGPSPRVLYAVNGEFNDWCYGETALKPSYFSWTPEVGSAADGFWPPASRMLPLAQENLGTCYYVAAIAGPHVRVERAGLVEPLPRGGAAHLALRARNLGASGQAGPGLTANLTSLSAGAHVIQGAVALPTLGSFESGEPLDHGRFLVAADDTVTLGRLLRFQVDFTAPDGYFSRDTIDVLCGVPQVLLLDTGSSGLVNWTATGPWGIQSDDVDHPGPFFADSPGGTYASNGDVALTLAATLDLSKAVHAWLFFDGRWDFDSDFDCGLVEASRPGVGWTPLAGVATTAGTPGTLHPAGQPGYDGSRRLWRNERVDLSPFAGPDGSAVSLRFRVLSNGSENYDGFRLDSLVVVTFDPALQPAPVAVAGASPPGALELGRPSPNPARSLARFGFTLPRPAPTTLEVLDLQGRRVRALAAGPLPAGRYEFGWDLRDDAGRRVAPGLFFVRLWDGATGSTRRLAVLP